MATQGKILVYKRQGKKGTTYTYRLEAGRDPITGKRKRVSKSGFKTAKEARAAAQPILNKLLLGKNVIESNIIFKEYADEWIKEYSLHLKKASLPTLISNVKVGIKYFGNKKIKDITIHEYQSFLNDYAIGRKKTTVERAHVILKNLFNTAVKYSIINSNPADNTVMPKIEPTKKDITSMYLTKNELLEFLDFAKNYKGYGSNYFYPLCLTLAYTGIRLGEACALLWENIDIENKIIKIESSMYSKNQNEYERQNSPKNLSSIRTIIIGNTLATELKKWKTEQLTLRVLYGTRNNKPNLDFVFTRFEKTKFKEIAVLQPTVQLIFTKINKKHLFNKKIYAHLFRHTHVSLLAEAGNISLESIQQRLGHSSDETTRKIYLHITEKSKLDTANTFENYMTK